MLDHLKAIARGVINFWDDKPHLSTAALCALIVTLMAIVRAL